MRLFPYKLLLSDSGRVKTHHSKEKIFMTNLDMLTYTAVPFLPQEKYKQLFLYFRFGRLKKVYIHNHWAQY